MNPGALFFLIIGLVLVVMGFKGTSDNLIAGAKGSPYGKSSLK